MPWKQVAVMNQREEFVLRAMKSSNFRELCQEYGISAKTGYKWKERFIRQGLEGFGELSRRPKSSPRELGESVVCEIIRLKQRHRHWGPRKIRAVYQRLHEEAVPSESSFKRVLERAGLVQGRRLRARQQSGRLFSDRKAGAPNEVWTVDFKGWYAKGQRCEPLTVRDEFSRYVLELRAMANARTETVRRCFERLFEQHGVPGAIRSDNGAPFASEQGVLGLSRLSAWWVALGIDLERGRPGCPQDNGGHERLHLDVERELRGADLPEQQAGFDEWRKTFNQERPHEALAMKCPVEAYTKSERKYEGTPDDLEYEGMDARKVAKWGSISWAGRWIFISGALAGWSVGVEPCGEGKYRVWFGRLLLGQLEERTLSFERAQPGAGKQTSLKPCDGSQVGRPQNGTQAHDTSRELELDRPARVGATPFWDRPTCEPAFGEYSQRLDPPSGDENR
jgi:putative transposase